MIDIGGLVRVDRLILAGRVKGRVLAHCQLLIADSIAIHEVNLIDGPNSVFVSMPSRLLKVECPACRKPVRPYGTHCYRCGSRLADRDKDYRDVVFPIHEDARRAIHGAVLDAYEAAVARAVPE